MNLNVYDGEIRQLHDEIIRNLDEMETINDQNHAKMKQREVQELMTKAKSKARAFMMESRKLKGDERNQYKHLEDEHTQMMESLQARFTHVRRGGKSTGAAGSSVDGRNRLLGDAAARGALVGVSSSSANRSIDDAENPQQAMQLVYDVQHESIASTDRALRAAERAKMAGTSALEELNRQGEIIDQASRDVDDIRDTTKRADKKLNQIIRRIACDKMIMSFMVLLGIGILFIIIWKSK